MKGVLPEIVGAFLTVGFIATMLALTSALPHVGSFITTAAAYVALIRGAEFLRARRSSHDADRPKARRR